MAAKSSGFDPQYALRISFAFFRFLGLIFADEDVIQRDRNNTLSSVVGLK